MKYFFTMMVCFLFCLPAMACSGSEASCEETELTISPLQATPQEGAETGCCKTLCSSSCCGIPVILASAAKLPLQKAQFISNVYIAYNISPKTEVFYPIWQPPKL